MQLGQDIHYAAKLIKTGKLVAFPTETVFGLGADATNDRAIASIYAAKNRPEFNPLIVHVSSVEQAKMLVEWNEVAEKLSRAFWPGALTLVLPRKADSPVSLLASAGLSTIAVRMPAHEKAQELITIAGVPIAAPSANKSGRVSATKAVHVAGDFAEENIYILDMKGADLGLESTVLNISDADVTLLRQGAIAQAEIEHVLGASLVCSTDAADRPSSPGQLLRHYAPHKKLRLNATSVNTNEALLAFGSNVPAGAHTVMNLSNTGNIQEAAANLFAMLRLLDATDASSIAVMPIPDSGLGQAINDRLKRAAS